MSDSELASFIKKGDVVENRLGQYEAVLDGHSRYGAGYELHIVSVQGNVCQLPIECRCIHAVYRNGVCIWRRGETLRQLSLFESNND